MINYAQLNTLKPKSEEREQSKMFKDRKDEKREKHKCKSLTK